MRRETRWSCGPCLRKVTDIDYQVMFAKNPNPMWVYDPQTLQFLAVNEAAIAHYGYSRKDFLARKVTDIRPPDEIDPALSTIEQVQDEGYSVSGRWKHRRADGSIIEVMVASNKVDFEGRPARIVAITDITDLQAAHEELRYLAHHDALTRLPNRALLSDRLEQAIAQSQRHHLITAVMFLDLDGFKPVNDTYGHAAGDELLIGVAHRLSGLIRTGDTVARPGGDEFIVLLPDLSKVDDATVMSQRILRAFAKPFVAGGAEHIVGTSIGIALAPFDGATAEVLMRSADAAMYNAKQRGGNCVQFFSDGINSAASKRVVLENALRSAVQHQEYMLLYQPIVSVREAKIIGMEALLRWNHPTLGTLKPSEFFSTLEETDFLMPLAQWTLDKACADRALWQRELGDMSVRLGWNASARELHNKRFTEIVVETLARYGLDPSVLEIDINEHILSHGTDEVFLAMEYLDARGVRFAIDDFGTGFSALEFLKHAPLQTLKLHQRLISDIVSDPFDYAMTKAIIDVAQKLDIRVLAEGVEDGEEWSFVSSLGCDEAQGDYFGPPLAAGEVVEFLKKPLTHVEEETFDFS